MQCTNVQGTPLPDKSAFQDVALRTGHKTSKSGRGHLLQLAYVSEYISDSDDSIDPFCLFENQENDSGDPTCFVF